MNYGVKKSVKDGVKKGVKKSVKNGVKKSVKKSVKNGVRMRGFFVLFPRWLRVAA